MFSGSWLIWSVRHKFTQEGHKMNFTLLRNGVGAAAASGGSLLSAAAGAL
jgi:hypothetical protein